MAETEREMAERHVAQGTDQVVRQRQRAADLTRDGHPAADLARELLRLMEEALGLHEAHLARLRPESAALRVR